MKGSSKMKREFKKRENLTSVFHSHCVSFSFISVFACDPLNQIKVSKRCDIGHSFSDAENDLLLIFKSCKSSKHQDWVLVFIDNN